jgi:desert hedgehog
VVEIQSGTLKRMDEVEIGDLVKVAPGMYSEVFMFTHKIAGTLNTFIQIQTSSGNTISLTDGHYIHVNGVMRPAQDVLVGDVVELATGGTTEVAMVSCVQLRGLYNPQTLQGDIAVNGIVASTYTTAVAPQFAHATLGALRVIYRALGVAFTSFENGAGSIATALPAGSSRV